MKIFFDVDGVIIHGWHFNPARRRPWDTNLKQDFGIEREAFQKAFFFPQEQGKDSLMEKCLKGDLDLKKVLADLLPSLGSHHSAEDFVDYWFARNSYLNEDVIAVIKQLQQRKDIELYLATAQEPYRANYLWHDLAFKELFRDIFFSARLGIAKDSAAFFSKINTVLDIGPEERPLYFDDTPDVVSAAKEAGWDAYEFDTIEDLNRNSRLLSILSDT
ncbi:MAG: HAD family hydrolase [Alphaproteobacteria bacterium]